MTTPAVLVPQGDPLAPTESLAPLTPTGRTFHARARTRVATFHEAHGTGPLPACWAGCCSPPAAE
ncbi:hypothetical protein [Amycolatopsis sp. CA-126428]|uniref:hypothetical protein n=1 Tax=Amycolatopsis sp. CA-126428 TaxID=2073158 RepID=UPI000CD0431C|nr:hypothetical protein [Amycolatopsis sp. CA-126428]